MLDLRQTGVTDTEIKALAGFTNLASLSLCHAKVTDAGLKELSRLQCLAVPDLSNKWPRGDDGHRLTRLGSLVSSGMAPEGFAMGMEQTVTFPADSTVSWPAVRDLLASRGIPVQVRMIDGELAFPHEEPSDNWRELRLGTTDGALVTVKREQSRLVLVVWGNADAGLVQTWNALTWAFAHVGEGSIRSANGSQNAADYWNHAELPAVLRSNPRGSQ